MRRFSAMSRRESNFDALVAYFADPNGLGQTLDADNGPLFARGHLDAASVEPAISQQQELAHREFAELIDQRIPGVIIERGEPGVTIVETHDIHYPTEVLARVEAATAEHLDLFRAVLNRVPENIEELVKQLRFMISKAEGNGGIIDLRSISLFLAKQISGKGAEFDRKQKPCPCCGADKKFGSCCRPYIG